MISALDQHFLTTEQNDGCGPLTIRERLERVAESIAGGMTDQCDEEDILDIIKRIDSPRWPTIESCPEYVDVLLFRPGHRVPVTRGKKFTRDDGIIWEFEGTSSHEILMRQQGWTFSYSLVSDDTSAGVICGQAK